MLPKIDMSPEFTGFQAVIPGVTYSDLEVQFSRRHKSPSFNTGIGATQDPENPEAPVIDSEVLKLIETAIQESNFESPVFGELSIHPSYSDLSKQINTYLYSMCQLYASDMYVGNIQLSPLLALAEANLEGGRVNTSMSFSGMAPTGVFKFESVDEVMNFSVVDCLRSKSIWKSMSSEYSTRDRGPLQCRSTYSFDRSQYGPSEYQRLQSYIELVGLPDYGTNRDSVGNTFTVADWVNSSRTMYGDRFNVASIIQMFADEKREVEIPGILRNFDYIQNEYHVYAIMAYNHWCGSGYMTMSDDTPYAGFQTIGRSKEYCEAISSPAAIEIIYSQCVQEIQKARASGRNPVKSLDKKSGRALFDVLYDQGIVRDWDYYFRHKTTGSWDQGATACSYPLGVIYGVIQMNLLYSGY